MKTITFPEALEKAQCLFIDASRRYDWEPPEWDETYGVLRLMFSSSDYILCFQTSGEGHLTASGAAIIPQNTRLKDLKDLVLVAGDLDEQVHAFFDGLTITGSYSPLHYDIPTLFSAEDLYNPLGEGVIEDYTPPSDLPSHNDYIQGNFPDTPFHVELRVAALLLTYVGAADRQYLYASEHGRQYPCDDIPSALLYAWSEYPEYLGGKIRDLAKFADIDTYHVVGAPVPISYPSLVSLLRKVPSECIPGLAALAKIPLCPVSVDQPAIAYANQAKEADRILEIAYCTYNLMEEHVKETLPKILRSTLDSLEVDTGTESIPKY